MTKYKDLELAKKIKLNNMTTNWIEEFNKEFKDLDMMESMAMLKGYKSHRKGWLTTQLKNFITTLLEKQREEYDKKIEYVMKKDEQVHGCQYNDKNEIDIYFNGFKDGRAMMRIDLLNIIKQK